MHTHTHAHTPTQIGNFLYIFAMIILLFLCCRRVVVAAVVLFLHNSLQGCLCAHNLRLKFRTHFRTLSLLNFHFRCRTMFSRVFSLLNREDSPFLVHNPLGYWVTPAFTKYLLWLTPFAVRLFSFAVFPLFRFFPFFRF